MGIEFYLTEQLKSHPSMQPQDVIKLCYQAAYGAEHLLKDVAAALEGLQKEFEAVGAKDGILFEKISDTVCRVNLASWKFKKLPIEWLFNMFVASVNNDSPNDELLCNYISEAERVLGNASINFTKEQWQDYLCEYKRMGMPAARHTHSYRQAEKPAYRIVNSKFIRLFPILEHIVSTCDKAPCVIAIDGRAASGKTTVAEQLKAVIGADIVQMDDFFLPPILRTAERLGSTGGNIHYERFIEEVLPYISKPDSFTYRIFDCSKMDYNGEKKIDNTHFRIVEGSYSTHPLFKAYADITVFSSVEPEEQMRRIVARNGEELAEMFKLKWIPFEEKYFTEFSVLQKADIVI